MSHEELQQALEQIEPGERIGILAYCETGDATPRELCDFRVGHIPESSGLATENTAAYVATDVSHGFEQVVVALEDIHNGEATIDVEPLTKSAEEDPVLLRGVMRTALSESEVKRGILNPSSPMAELPSHILRAAGLVEISEGHYQIAA